MEREQWNNLVIKHGGEFLQSWGWGEFQESLGKRVERITTEDFLAQVVFQPLPWGLNYGYVPRGPIVLRDDIRSDSFWREFDKIRASTVFFELELSNPITFLEPLSKQTRQPFKTSVLELTVPTDAIFFSFNKTLRTNIRRAEKNGINIKQDADWRPFFALLAQTASRQGFRIWPRQYFEKLWLALAPKGMLEIWSARYQNKLLAAHLYILFGSRVIYLYGASDYNLRSLMAPHLLHWRAIQEFKQRGFKEYDFWGLDEKRFPGVTKFKLRFGGSIKTYPGSYVKVLRLAWHRFYQLARQWLR